MEDEMRMSNLRNALIALVALLGIGLGAAYADGGPIRFNIIKAGFVIGG